MKNLILIVVTLFLLNVFGSAQDIQLQTSTGILFGTMLQPEDNPSSTLAIIHAGSGPTDRNGNQVLMKNNSLKLLAEALSENGIASLRYDKRAIGESKIENFREEDYLFDDLVQDLRDWITKMDAEYDYKKIVVIGHSEGSLIGMLACQDNPLADKYISLAGIGREADKVLLTQLSEQGPGVAEMVTPYLEKLKNGDTIADIPTSLTSLFRPSVQPYLISWFKYNPVEEIAKLNIPVLVIQGNTDIQVAVSEAELLHEAAKNSELVIIKNMNHVLKTCKEIERKKQMLSYADPEMPLPKKFVKAMAKFILK